VLDVLGLDGSVHAHLAMGHTHNIRCGSVALLDSFLVLVALLQLTAGCLAVVVGEDASDGGLGPITLAVTEIATGQHHWLVIN